MCVASNAINPDKNNVNQKLFFILLIVFFVIILILYVSDSSSSQYDLEKSIFGAALTILIIGATIKFFIT